MFKSILISIFFLLFVYSLFFPAAVKAQQCVDPDPTGAIPCGFECTIGTTDSQTKCCSTQNDCYNLQQTEGPGSNPVAPVATAPNPAVPAAVSTPAVCVTKDQDCSAARLICDNGTAECAGYYCEPVAEICVQRSSPSSTASSTIGNLDVGQSKSVTISSLDAGKKYYLATLKATSRHILNLTVLNLDLKYTNVLVECETANSSGEITKLIGPFSLPGYYRLEIYRASSSSAKCEQEGAIVSSQDFSVGEPTGDSCCSLGHPTYYQSEDVCKRDPFDPLGLSPKSASNCKSKNTYCEPQSLMCFKSKTYLISGKICKDPNEGGFDPKIHAVCASAKGIACDPNDSINPGFRTAIGCIHTNPQEFVKDFLTFIIAIAGGFAFLLMLMGAFQMVTSAGNPDSLNAGRERLTSAIIGLLFVIFAVLLMQIIGISILNIPGFGK